MQRLTNAFAKWIAGGASYFLWWESSGANTTTSKVVCEKKWGSVHSHKDYLCFHGPQWWKPLTGQQGDVRRAGTWCRVDTWRAAASLTCRPHTSYPLVCACNEWQSKHSFKHLAIAIPHTHNIANFFLVYWPVSKFLTLNFAISVLQDHCGICPHKICWNMKNSFSLENSRLTATDEVLHISLTREHILLCTIIPYVKQYCTDVCCMPRSTHSATRGVMQWVA